MKNEHLCLRLSCTAEGREVQRELDVARQVELEGARLHDTCAALCAIKEAFGVAADGGKDSLGMAARASRIPLDTTPHSTAFQMKTAVTDTTVKAPGSVMVSVYAPVGDICRKITPDLKCCDYDPGEPKVRLRSSICSNLSLQSNTLSALNKFCK